MFRHTLKNLTQAQLETLADATEILESAWQCSNAQPVVLIGPDTPDDERASIRHDQGALLNFLRLKYAGRKVEYASVILIDGYGRLVAVEKISRGSEGQTSIPARDVARIALTAGARGVVLVHNHPGGNPKPSKQDIEATAHLSHVLAPLDIELIDHVVVAAAGYCSIRREVLRQENKLPDVSAWPEFSINDENNEDDNEK